MIIHITPELEGRMLRSYLTHTLALSTATLSRLKNHERGIVVNGERVTVRCILHAGDVLELADRDTAETATRTVLPVALPLDILYEDDYILALHKPAGMPTHPSHGHLTDTLANALAGRYAERGEPFVFRPLGRLDRNTSGVVVMGKTRAASGCLGRALQQGQVAKRYLALLEGFLAVGNGKPALLDTYMHRLDAPGIRRAVCSADTPGAERAVTVYRVLAVSERYTLVLAEPRTGRTHQLRVHFAHLGHPLVGDDLYGTPSPLLDRHALHALLLSVPRPFFHKTNESECTERSRLLMGKMEREEKQPPRLTEDTSLNAPTPDGYVHVYAPLPPDMANLCRQLFPDAPVQVVPAEGMAAAWMNL